MLLKLEHTAESPGELAKTQTADLPLLTPAIRVSDSEGLGICVANKLPSAAAFWRPHFE